MDVVSYCTNQPDWHKVFSTLHAQMVCSLLHCISSSQGYTTMSKLELIANVGHAEYCSAYICAKLCGICISLAVNGVADTLMPR